MADKTLKLIPRDPDFLPDGGKVTDAKQALEGMFPAADEISVDLGDERRFFDCGANFEKVLCPLSGEEIELELWQDAMDRAAVTKFTDLSFINPANGEEMSLNDLVYDWPQGFAKFGLCVLNPGAPDLAADDVAKLEVILGCRLTKILGHY